MMTISTPEVCLSSPVLLLLSYFSLSDGLLTVVMPFVSLALPEDHFDALRSESLGGDHKVVENVGRSSFHLRRSPLIRCRGGHGDADSMRAGGVGDAENE